MANTILREIPTGTAADDWVEAEVSTIDLTFSIPSIGKRFVVVPEGPYEFGVVNLLFDAKEKEWNRETAMAIIFQGNGSAHFCQGHILDGDESPAWRTGDLFLVAIQLAMYAESY